MQELRVGSRIVWLRGRHRGEISVIKRITSTRVVLVNQTRRRHLKGPFTVERATVSAHAEVVA